MLVLVLVLTVGLAVAVIVVTCLPKSEASDRGIDWIGGIVRVGRGFVFARGPCLYRDERRERKARGCGIEATASADGGRRGGMIRKEKISPGSSLYSMRSILFASHLRATADVVVDV